MKKNRIQNIKSTGFTTPDNYFDSLESKLFDGIQDSQIIGDVQETGFKVPKDYFKTVESNILEKINSEDTTPVIKMSSRRKFYYFSGIAASVLLLLAIFLNKPATEEFSVEVVSTYLENTNLDSYELAELLANADLLDDDFTIVETEYTEENLESYLLEHGDIESILE